MPKDTNDRDAQRRAEREAAMPPTEPGNHNEPESDPNSSAWEEGQTGKLSGAGWGSEPAGGSVVDKRGPKKES